MNAFKKYYWLTLTVVLTASIYPICMGIRIVVDMLRFGTVYAENYPKYIIPYTPIALALIIGTALMPVLLSRMKKLSLLFSSLLAIIIFAVSELLLESQVIVTTTITTKLESWQMYMCYVPPEGYADRTWTEVNVLMGEYTPAFKVHFYIISILLILSLLNCIYGFAQMIISNDTSRKKALIMQLVCSLVFLGLCILACFTAFFRTGEMTVSNISAVLMILFFIIMGITTGIYISSFMIGKPKLLSTVLPSLISSVVTLTMYIGEMLLLSWHLYRFGKGFFFTGLGKLVLAPIDICVVLGSGFICYLLLIIINRKKTDT